MSNLRALSVRMPPEEYARLEAEARQEGRSLANYARAKLLNGEEQRKMVEQLESLRTSIEQRLACLDQLNKLEPIEQKLEQLLRQ